MPSCSKVLPNHARSHCRRDPSRYSLRATPEFSDVTGRTIVPRDIDTTSALARFEEELRDTATPPHRRDLILSILARWADDPDLTLESRRRARQLQTRFQA